MHAVAPPWARRLLTINSINVGDPEGATSSCAMLRPAWVIKRRFDHTQKPARYLIHLHYDSFPASQIIPSADVSLVQPEPWQALGPGASLKRLQYIRWLYFTLIFGKKSESYSEHNQEAPLLNVGTIHNTILNLVEIYKIHSTTFAPPKHTSKMLASI